MTSLKKQYRMYRQRMGKPIMPRCHFCPQSAVYEGWVRNIDPFTGKPTGKAFKVFACEEHVKLTIGWQKQHGQS